MIKNIPLIEKLQFLENSRCASNNEENAFLLTLLGNKRFVTTLLLRGSVHGWKFKDFHSRCDGKRPTISLFKVRDSGDCIGGYTNISWSSPNPGKNYSDNDAILLNLSN